MSTIEALVEPGEAERTPIVLTVVNYEYLAGPMGAVELSSDTAQLLGTLLAADGSLTAEQLTGDQTIEDLDNALWCLAYDIEVVSGCPEAVVIDDTGDQYRYRLDKAFEFAVSKRSDVERVFGLATANQVRLEDSWAKPSTPEEQISQRTFEFPGEWRQFAACLGVDANVFYPEKSKAKLARAQHICSGCSVSMACLDYALAFNELDGVWGGASEDERRRLRRQRNMHNGETSDTNAASINMTSDNQEFID